VGEINLWERIENENNLNSSEVAYRLNISKSYYSMLKNRNRNVSKNVAIKIHQEFNISLEDCLLSNQLTDSENDKEE